MAYHLDKFRRGFPLMIDVWGADHGGYVKRMTAGVKALTEGKGALDVKICQLVNLKRGGELVKMSKRSGTFVTLREVIEEVGKRSEEHTSELQSLMRISYAVFCLKKKNKKKQ